MTITQRLPAMLFAVLLAALSTSASAAFPDKSLRLIVPFTAGGAADVMAPP